MRIRFAIGFLCSLTLSMGASLQRFDKATTEQAAFAAHGTIRIEGSTGDLNIEGWDQPSVEITATRFTWSHDAERAKVLLDSVVVEKPAVNGNELVIKTLHKRMAGVQVTYRIRVPRDSSLVISHETGTVVVYDVAGDVSASAKVGDILLQLPGAQYAIDAKNKSGGAIVSDFAGSMRYSRLLLGETLKVDAAAPARHLALHVGVGGITIQKMPVVGPAAGL